MPLVSTRQRDDDREEVLFLRRAPGIDGTPLFLYFYFLPFFSLFSCPPSSVLHPLIHYYLLMYVECERRKMQRCPDKIFVKRSPDYFLVRSIYERVRYLLFISLLKKIFVVENEILLLQNALLPFLQSTQKFGTLMSQILDCVA